MNEACVCRQVVSSFLPDLPWEKSGRNKDSLNSTVSFPLLTAEWREMVRLLSDAGVLERSY